MIGGAQSVNIVANILKMKVAAVLLGPAGVGLVGLYGNLIQTGAMVAGVGLGTVGARQTAITQAGGCATEQQRIRWALLGGGWILGALGALLFWLASGWIAGVLFVHRVSADSLRWLALGVALSVAGGTQAALLAGLRRVGDLARTNILAGAGGAVLGVLALLHYGMHGLIAMVIATPLVSWIVGHFYVVRSGVHGGGRPRATDVFREWATMLGLGSAFMVSGLATLIGQLAVRTLIQRKLGAGALGQFQAAWTIGMTYLSFILGAMGTDFFPRLSAAMKDPASAAQLVNEQTEVALYLCAPILLAMLGLAPWVIHLLYASNFDRAEGILRWQLLGDVLKVMSWPLGFVLVAAGAGKTFALCEWVSMAVFVLGVFFGLPFLGVTATGVSFLLLYVVYLPMVWWLGARRIGMHWNAQVLSQAALLMAFALSLDLVALWSEVAGAFLGLAMAVAMAIRAFVRLSGNLESERLSG